MNEVWSASERPTDRSSFPLHHPRTSTRGGGHRSMAAPKRAYYKVVLGKTEFEVDVRYHNLRPIGRGAYGLVASADDLVRARQG